VFEPKVTGLWLELGATMQILGCKGLKVYGFGFVVWGLGSRDWSLGLRDQGLGSGVSGYASD